MAETMADMWNTFTQMVIPEEPVDSEKYKDFKKTFYGGAMALFGWFMTQMDLDEEPTDGDMDRVTAMAEELNEFGVKVLQGLD